MIKSMTGYGRGESIQQEYRITAEIKAVNHRYAEINIRMPRDLSLFEESVKKLISEQIRRGRVETYITFERLSGGVPEVSVNLPLAREIKSAADRLAAELSIESDLSISQLLQFDGVVEMKEREANEQLAQQVLVAAVAEAVRNLTAMRQREGEQLSADFLQRLDKLAELVKRLTERSPLVVADYRDRLEKRLQEWISGQVGLDESRLATEVTLFAERVSIEEELVRLKSHIGQFQMALQSDEPVGRKLDFLVQEMNREINTVGSKANDLQISQYVVEAKSILEQIREQVQNVE
ncbi:YicC/YloC family endoribonuclease [Effusibacillus dendaii]|uniref:YicC family protein n=1 Tax=Effusibacillus dendaii TaxID=2743772 RepID=A0A7I8D4X9_9BACL|nr:YicC/YloC family endoribonuclease [Effusibacillus dendaii]BCJ85117.1 hypothetical protein skT53_01020 [Effusibacillus dendaii]